MEIRKNRFVRLFLGIISIVALLVIVLVAWYLKLEAESRLNSLNIKIPRNEAELRQLSDNLVTEVVRSATDGGIRKVLGQTSEFFEESEIAAPARSIRNDAKATFDELLERLKALPAEEYQAIKQKIYEVWLKDSIEKNYGGN